MITVYESTETNFTHNGLGVLLPTLCDITEELNGIYELELEHPYDDRGRWKNLVEDNIIKSDGQLFRIYNKTKLMSGIRVNARHIFYDLLDNFLEDVRPENLNGAAALDWILTRTQYTHSFTSMSDISTTNTVYFVRKNPVEAIMGTDGIVAKWGGELVRDNFTIKLLSQRGLDRGVHIRYKKNLKEIEEDLNTDSVITRLMPIGYNGLLLPEKYIDSPLINIFPHPKIRKVEFSDIKIDEANGITQEIAIQNLRDTATAWMESTKCDIPFANYKVDFIELSKTVQYKDYAVLERVYLGDTVTIKHEKLGFDLKAKVIKYKKDVLRDKYKEIELGNFKENIGSNITKTINQISEVIENNKSDLQKAIDNATTLLTSALGGYVLKRAGEILIMDTEDPNTAVKVWRWNLNGLGYSSTGINGQFGLALTMDGSIVADFITTGILNANLIKTGIIQSVDGTTTINMENGAIKVESTNVNTYTTMQADGFRVWNATNDEEVANFGSDGAGMTKLNVGFVYANNILNCNDVADNGKTIDLYVNPGHASATDYNNIGRSSSKPFKSLNACLQIIPKVLRNLTTFRINVTGTISEGVIRLSGISGDGTIILNLDKSAIINGIIYVSCCQCKIDIMGNKTNITTNDGALIANEVGWSGAIVIDNCLNVLIHSLRIDGQNRAPLINLERSNVDIDSIDGYNAGITDPNKRAFIDANHNSHVTAFNNRGGNTWYYMLLKDGSIGFVRDQGYKPACGEEIMEWGGKGFWYGTQTSADTLIVPPPPVTTQTYTKQWSGTSYIRKRSSYSDTGEFVQGYWGSYGNSTSFVRFDDADIRSNLSSATGLSGRIYLQRLNTSHGYTSGATAHLWGGNGDNKGEDFGYLGDLAQGQSVWFTLPTSFIQGLQNGSITEVCVYDNSTTNYIKYETNVVIEITYNK